MDIKNKPQPLSTPRQRLLEAQLLDAVHIEACGPEAPDNADDNGEVIHDANDDDDDDLDDDDSDLERMPEDRKSRALLEAARHLPLPPQPPPRLIDLQEALDDGYMESLAKETDAETNLDFLSHVDQTLDDLSSWRAAHQHADDELLTGKRRNADARDKAAAFRHDEGEETVSMLEASAKGILEQTRTLHEDLERRLKQCSKAELLVYHGLSGVGLPVAAPAHAAASAQRLRVQAAMTEAARAIAGGVSSLEDKELSAGGVLGAKLGGLGAEIAACTSELDDLLAQLDSDDE